MKLNWNRLPWLTRIIRVPNISLAARMMSKFFDEVILKLLREKIKITSTLPSSPINSITGGQMFCKKKQEINRFKRDFNFSLIILSLNILFVIFNLPICVVNLLDDAEYYVFNLVDVLFYCQYIFNILVYLVANSEFKRELFIMLRIRKRLNNFTQTG